MTPLFIKLDQVGRSSAYWLCKRVLVSSKSHMRVLSEGALIGAGALADSYLGAHLAPGEREPPPL